MFYNSNRKIQGYRLKRYAKSSRCWFVTWFFTHGKEVTDLLRDNWRQWSQFYGQIETSKLGHRHLQCVVEWPQPVGFNYVRKLFHNSHVEATIDLQDAAAYCLKVETRSGPQFYVVNRVIYCTSKVLEKLLRSGLDPGPD